MAKEIRAIGAYLEHMAAVLAWFVGTVTTALIAATEVDYDRACLPPRAFCFAEAVIGGIINPRPILSAAAIAAGAFVIVGLTIWRRGPKRWVAEIGFELGEASPGLFLVIACPFALLVGISSVIVWLCLGAVALSFALYGACYLYQPQVARERIRQRRERGRERRVQRRRLVRRLFWWRS